MAAQKDTTPKGAQDPQTFDLSKFLPKEYGDQKDLRVVEGLIPAYIPEVALAEGWDPLIGKPVRLHVLPTRDEGTKQEYTPVAWEFLLDVANKGVVGNKMTGQRIVDRKVGESILVFVSGNLIMKRDFWMAFVNPQNTFGAALRVTGQQKVNNMNPMWVWDTRLTPHTFAREGALTLYPHDFGVKHLPDLIQLVNDEIKGKDFRAKWNAIDSTDEEIAGGSLGKRLGEGQPQASA